MSLLETGGERWGGDWGGRKGGVDSLDIIKPKDDFHPCKIQMKTFKTLHNGLLYNSRSQELVELKGATLIVSYPITLQFACHFLSSTVPNISRLQANTEL